MKETAVIVALVLLFASSHLLLSSRGRARLAARLGARRFLVAYSVVSPSRTFNLGLSCGPGRTRKPSSFSWCSRTRPGW